MRNIRRWIAVALAAAVLALGADPAAGRAGSGRLRPPDDDLTIPLTEVLDRERPADRAKFDRQRQQTYAAVYVNGRRVGEIYTDDGEGHAEQNLAASRSLERALRLARRLQQRGEDVVVDLVLNRAPCSGETCAPLTVYAARRFAERGIPFRAVVTGTYMRPSPPNLPTTVGWIDRMLRTGAEVLVGVPSDGRVRIGGRSLLTALQNVHRTRSLFNAGGSHQARGPVTQALAGGATSAPGGIDFTSLELRYLAEPDGDTGDAQGGGLRYAFAADAVAAGEPGRPDVGLRVAEQQSDAFFVWLSLPPSAFWVNLNPDEPDRVVDDQLGRTDVGRVLLEADLQMKRTVGRLIHPDTPLGARFWDRLERGGGNQTCFSFRQWVVPGEAVVHQDGDGLYILDAPLEVQLESEYFAQRGVAGADACRAVAPDVEADNEAAFRSLILPEVERAVNEAPEYAALRRVYLSRVAAEWYRQRSFQAATAYGHLVDSGDVARWTSDRPWSPRHVFDEYVRSYTEGEFNVTRETRQGDWITTNTYVYGGVDFTRIALSQLRPDEFRARWPDLAELVGESFEEPAAAATGGDVWLGAALEPARSTGPARPERPPGPSRQVPGRGRDIPSLRVVALVAAGVAVVVRRLVLSARGRT